MKIYIKPTMKGWAVLPKGNTKPSDIYKTPQQALDAARDMLPMDNSEIVVLAENREHRRAA